MHSPRDLLVYDPRQSGYEERHILDDRYHPFGFHLSSCSFLVFSSRATVAGDHTLLRIISVETVGAMIASAASTAVICLVSRSVPKIAAAATTPLANTVIEPTASAGSSDRACCGVGATSMPHFPSCLWVTVEGVGASAVGDGLAVADEFCYLGGELVGTDTATNATR